MSIMRKTVIFLTFLAILKYSYGRIVDPSERDPLRIKWFLWEDERGLVRNESLLQWETNPRAGSVADIKLMLFTKNNSKSYEALNPVNITDLTNSLFFDARRQNVFLIHGWQNNWKSKFNTLIRDAMLETRDVNIFVVDWAKVARKLYSSSKRAVPGIGQAIGNYINQMMDHYAINGDRIMLIGHSLGAHAAGTAGTTMKSKPHQIVGLDPASPLISVDDLGYRLDPQDGQHVHIIHTDGRMFGFRSSLGHSDFYPNGGAMQPGCIIDPCAHSRSYQLYAETLRSCKFKAVLCENYSMFKKGLCKENPHSFMGCFDVDDKAEGDYFLKTRGKSPYLLAD